MGWGRVGAGSRHDLLGRREGLLLHEPMRLVVGPWRGLLLQRRR